MDERWTESLSAWLDDELPAAEARVLEERLAADPELRAVLDDLREVRQRARALPAPPVPDELWDGIAGRIGANRRGGAAVVHLPRRLFTLSLPQIVAAAAVLVLASALGVWTLRGRVDERALAQRTTPAGPTLATPTTQAAGFDAVRIEGEIALLQQALERGRGKLDPQTISVLEKNLALIRQATEDAKRALAADPANVELQRYFTETVANKLDMMKRATEMAGV